MLCFVMLLNGIMITVVIRCLKFYVFSVIMQSVVVLSVVLTFIIISVIMMCFVVLLSNMMSIVGMR